MSVYQHNNIDESSAREIEDSPAAATALMFVQSLGADVVKTYGVDGAGHCLFHKGIDCHDAGKHPIGGYYKTTRSSHVIRAAPIDCNWSLQTGFPFVGVDDDTDDNSGIAAVEAEIGGTLPITATIRTGGGHQTKLYRTAQRLPKCLPIITSKHGNVDFLGYPHIAVLPGSRSGKGLYEWKQNLSPLEVGISDLPVGIVQLVKSKSGKGDATQSYFHPPDYDTEVHVSHESAADIERLMRRCVPDKIGLRHLCLFRLARGLRGLPEYAEATAEELEPILQEWYRRALPSIGTKDIKVCRRDLWEGYKRVRFPGGTHGKLASMVDPDFGSAPLLIRVGKLCAALQAANGDKPFFLDCRSGGEVLGAHHATINRILNSLISTQPPKLKLVTPGRRRRAAEYYWIGGDE